MHAGACSKQLHGALDGHDIKTCGAGLTNEYLVNTGADAAMTYNDRSVNENGHASLGFRLLHRATNNFLEARTGQLLFPTILLVDWLNIRGWFYRALPGTPSGKRDQNVITFCVWKPCCHDTK